MYNKFILNSSVVSNSSISNIHQEKYFDAQDEEMLKSCTQVTEKLQL